MLAKQTTNRHPQSTPFNWLAKQTTHIPLPTTLSPKAICSPLWHYVIEAKHSRAPRSSMPHTKNNETHQHSGSNNTSAQTFHPSREVETHTPIRTKTRA
ncbi:hypothetical protein [Rubritalea tangerina]|uniref:hypothetical protein n=1 Tax=Rubritalea tangerina TaxID=430798 RepID=UPI00361288E6